MGKLHLDRGHLQGLYRDMLRIRRFEAKCAQLYQAQQIRGFLHLYDGEEAVAAGVMRSLKPQDAVVATYREHGQALARGVPMDALMAEMFGKVQGCSRGRGGSMHVFDAKRRFFGGNAIVGGGLPLAAGIALADKRLGRGAVTACFFGEGAVTEGAFHETMNLAALWKLPVLFVCENNLYAMGVALAAAESEPNLWHKAQAYRMASAQADGMDAVAMEAAARDAVEQVRAGAPFFLECLTYRFRAHSMFDAQLYRTREEVERWRERDPIDRLRTWMVRNHEMTESQEQAIEQEIADEIARAVAYAEAGAPEDIGELERFVLMDDVPQEREVAP